MANFSTSFISCLPSGNADDKLYDGGIYLPATEYMLNKTAMDAALTAWGVPTF